MVHPFYLQDKRMSFKIYDGVKLEGITTLEEAQSFIEEIREAVIENVHRESAKQIKRVACLLYDQYHFNKIDGLCITETQRKPLLTATSRIQELNRELGNREYNIGIAFVDGYTLSLPFFQDKESITFLRSHPKVSFFGYWDNTDPDENASEEEWNLRGKLWSKVFVGHGIPAECMLMVRLIDVGYIIPEDKYMMDLPTIEEREETLSRTLAMETMGDWSPDKYGSLGEWNRQIKEKSDEHLEQIKGKLNTDLSMEDLGKSVPKLENNNDSNKKQETGSSI
jgi:hypothetical protein